MEIEFKSVRELYERVTPALKSKVKELKKNNITYINENDIWNCLIELYWKKEKGLVLSEIVDDILNTDNSILEEYKKEQMKKVETKENLDDEII